MTTLRARDLMTPDVITVPPETPVLAIARLLGDRGISAVPVVDAQGQTVGVVTEGDLIRRLAGEQDKPAGWFASLFADPETLASAVAHVMEDRSIRRVLVTQEGRLKGIVSRADLLRALVAPPEPQGELSDERIRRAVLAAMKKEPWADTFYTMVEVTGGVVQFHGFSRSAAVQRGLRVLAENVPGVKSVVDNTQPMPAYLFATG
jgi:CBS domain-containing protein